MSRMMIQASPGVPAWKKGGQVTRTDRRSRAPRRCLRRTASRAGLRVLNRHFARSRPTARKMCEDAKRRTTGTAPRRVRHRGEGFKTAYSICIATAASPSPGEMFPRGRNPALEAGFAHLPNWPRDLWLAIGFAGRWKKLPPVERTAQGIRLRPAPSRRRPPLSTYAHVRGIRHPRKLCRTCMRKVVCFGTPRGGISYGAS